MRVVRLGVGFAVAILFAALLVRNVDLSEVIRAGAMLGPNFVAASLTLVIAGYSVRAWRWQLMLRGAGVGVTYRQAAPIFFAAFALNNVLPLRAGDVYRCVSIVRFADGTIAKSLATLLTERLLDLGAITILLSVLLLWFPNASLKLLSLPMTAFLIVGLFVLVVLIAFPVAIRRSVEAVLLHGFDRAGTVAKVATWILALTVAIEGTLSGHSRLTVIALTVLAWSLELGLFVVVGSVVSGNFLLSGGLYAGVLGTLATLIPGAPGHFGTFDFFAAEGFRYAGLDAEKAVAAAIVCHVAVLAPVTILGSIQLITDRRAGLNAP
jgi:glycosyltransferase 2 family protein